MRCSAINFSAQEIKLMGEETRPWGLITKYNPPTCERDYTLCVWEDDQPKTLCESIECQKDSPSRACQLACADNYLSRCFATQSECEAYQNQPSWQPTSAPLRARPILRTPTPAPISSDDNNMILMNVCIFLLIFALILGAMVFVLISSG